MLLRRHHKAAGAAVSTLLTGLVSYWKLDESSGNALDAENSNDGTVVGGVTQGASGKLGTAYSFSGSGQYVDFGDIAALDGITKLSAFCWINRGGTLNTSDAILTKWNYATQGNFGWQTGNLAGDEMSIFIATSLTDPGSGCRVDTTNANQTTNTFYHVGFVFDGTLSGDSNRLKFYQDGTQLSVSQGAGAVPASLQSPAADFLMGRFIGLGRYYPGTIDEVGVWDKALTSSEITELYNSGTGVTHPF